MVSYFRYRSRFFLLTPRFPNGFAMHLGTGVDWIVHRKVRAGANELERQRAVMRSVIEGLLAIGDDVASGRMAADTVLVGTSNFFSANTLRSLGLGVVGVGWLDRAVFLLGWLDASVWYPLHWGRPRLISVRRLTSTRAAAREIAAMRPRLQQFHRRLSRSG